MDNLCQFLEPTGGHDRVIIEEKGIAVPLGQSEIAGTHESDIHLAGQYTHPRIPPREAREGFRHLRLGSTVVHQDEGCSAEPLLASTLSTQLDVIEGLE